MLKTIIASIRSYMLHEIRRGVKKYEVRKNSPWCEPPFRVLLCECGSGGKIKAEFVCDYVRCGHITANGDLTLPVGITPEDCCLRFTELGAYSSGKPLYFWHISEMVDYCSTKGQRVRNIREFGIKRPPQSWQYLKESGGERNE